MWLDWVVHEELELSLVEKQRTRSNTELEPISVNTLKKVHESSGKQIEKETS